MSDDPAKPSDARAQRGILSVTPDELAQVDLEAPITSCVSFDLWELGDRYSRAAEEAQKAEQHVDVLVYSLLQGLCHMMLRPADRSEPYGPLIAWADGRRSIIPSDLSATLNDAFAAHVVKISNPVLRARLADITWVNNKRLGASAAAAVDAYCTVVERLRAGELLRRSERADVTDHDVMGQLRRACQIAVLTTGKTQFPERLRNLIVTARLDACARKYLHGYLQSAELDLDFGISDAGEIAREAEGLFAALDTIGDGHLPLAVLEFSIRAFRDADDKDGEARVTTAAAECCVTRADAVANSPLHESHWLTRAIAICGRTRANRDRRNELKKRLIDVQARTLDDFKPIGESIHIGDIVDQVREEVSGKSLASGLRMLALASRSPQPADLRETALDTGKRSLFASLFETTVLDSHGKVTFRSPGLSGKETTEQEAAVRFQIMQHEDMRRGLVVKSTLEPARVIINVEHEITPAKLLPLVKASPFVPPGHEFVFALGFARWFGGDLVSAVSILVPQLEASLRYLLVSAGEDVTTMKNDGTQEDRSISSLFDNMREQLVQVLGEPIVFELENVFLFRGGPGLRHAVAHGQLPTGGFHSHTADYGVWLMFQLCCFPLMDCWGEIEAALNTTA